MRRWWQGRWWGGHGRAAGLALLGALALGGCREEGKALKPRRRTKLPAPVSAAASLRIDAMGREWIVDSAGAVVVDTGRTPRVSRIGAGAGTPLPAPMWDALGRLYADSARPAIAEMALRAGVKAPSLRLSGPVARDPRGRWIYATIRHAGIVGMTADSLHTLWGWPHAGPAATALAVSPLADRVYLALDSSTVEGTDPRVQVRDQQSGRVLASLAQPAPLRWVAVARTGVLFGYAEAEGKGSVVSLAHVVGGLEERWRVSLRRVGLDAPAAVRVSPAGDRVAVFGRKSGGVRLLDAATGAVIGHEDESPLDAAFDAGGRLHLLYARRTEVIP